MKAQRVPDNQRMSFLPKHFGERLMIVAENLVYDNMRRLCAEYDGGYWHYYELSNGGFYMAPDISAPMHLVHADNHFDGEMSADAAGIVACMYAINQLCHVEDEEVAEKMVNAYHLLREFANQHAEGGLIYGATN